LIIRGKANEIQEAEDLIEELDHPIPQILIQSKVVEIAEADSLKLGFDHNSGIFKFVNGKRAGDIVSTLNTLISNGDANLMASPKVATLDNHEAIINIGNRVPYAVPVTQNGNTTQWTVQYIDAGVKLKITPQLGEENYITTSIQPEVSSISEWRTTSAGDFPVISTRNASSTVRVKNGETIVIGGLISEVDRVNTSRLPILGQIPFVHLLFSERTVEKSKVELVFMITPYLI
jgi:type II secretory pathway component GspD/PulD (secretin)